MLDEQRVQIRRLQRPGMLNAWFSYCGLSPVFSRVWRSAAELLSSNLEPGAKVLELGCGSGGFTRYLIQQNFACTAVEWNAWLLREAGQHLRKRELWGDDIPAELVLADSFDLPFEAGSFAVTVNFLSLHARSQREQEDIFAQLRRLAPKALFLDWQLPERNIDIPAASLSSFLAKLSQRLGMNDRRNTRVKDYYAQGALEGILYRERQSCRVLERTAYLGGSLGLALVEWT